MTIFARSTYQYVILGSEMLCFTTLTFLSLSKKNKETFRLLTRNAIASEVSHSAVFKPSFLPSILFRFSSLPSPNFQHLGISQHIFVSPRNSSVSENQIHKCSRNKKKEYDDLRDSETKRTEKNCSRRTQFGPLFEHRELESSRAENLLAPSALFKFRRACSRAVRCEKHRASKVTTKRRSGRGKMTTQIEKGKTKKQREKGTKKGRMPRSTYPTEFPPILPLYTTLGSDNRFGK